MKKFIIGASFLLLSLLAVPGAAQTILPPVNLTAASTDCSVANSCFLVTPPPGWIVLSFQLTGTFSETIQVEGIGGDITGTTWTSVLASSAGAGTSATTISAVGSYSIVNTGFTAIRLRVSTYTSGTATATATLGRSAPSSSVSVSGSNPAAGSTGSAVPSSASYDAANISGTLTGLTAHAQGATSKAQDVCVTDSSGNCITSFGGGTEYTNGGAVASGSLIGKSIFGYDGTNVRAANTDSSGHFNVNFQQYTPNGDGGLPVHLINGGSGGTSLADRGAVTVGSTLATPASGLYESSPTTCTTGTACLAGLTVNRELKIALTAMTASIPAGSNTIGGVNFAQYTPNGDGGLPIHVVNGQATGADNSTNSTTKAPVLPCTASSTDPSWTTTNQVPCSVTLAGYQRALTSPAGGIPVIEAALSTTVQTVVASGPHVLTLVSCSNANQTATNFAYVQVFDVSGTVTLGSTAPNIFFYVGANSPGGSNQINATFTNAIKVAATTTATGSSAPATALDCTFIYR